MRARTILVALASLSAAGCWDLSYELAGSGGSASSVTGSSSPSGSSATGDTSGAGEATSTAPSTTDGAGPTSTSTGATGSGGAGGAPSGGGGDGGAPSPTTTSGDQTTADGTSTGSDASSTTTATTGGFLDPDGTPCSSGQSCQSGFCVDDVCCNEACDGPCVACAGFFHPGEAGQCRSYEQEDPEDECPDCDVCDLGMCSDPCVAEGKICCMLDQPRCRQPQLCF